MVSNFDHGQAMRQIYGDNIGARSVCSSIFARYPLQVSEEIFLAMLRTKITGSTVWIFYKDKAGEDLGRMIELIRMTRSILEDQPETEENL